MYLHIGQGAVIRESTIIGIFDMDNTTISKHTRRFLNEAEKSGSVVAVSAELPKAFVVCADKGRTDVYLSQLATATLKRRLKQRLE